MRSNFPPIKKSVERMFKELHTLRNGYKQAKQRADLDRQDGWPTRTGNFEGHITGKSDPTAALALGPKDDIEQSQKRLANNVIKAERHLKLANHEIRYLTGMNQEEGQRLNRSLSQTVTLCVNCQDVITGVGDNRVKVGRCPTCYAYFNRTKTDRPTKGLSR